MGIEQYYNLSNMHPDWYQVYNVSKTTYHDGSVRYYYYKNEQYMFTEEGKEEFFPEDYDWSSERKGSYKTWIERKFEAESNLERSLRRSKRVLKDYILNNHNGRKCWFVTLTSGQQSIPIKEMYPLEEGEHIPPEISSEWAYDDTIVLDNKDFKKRLLKKMNNIRNKYPDFQYILIPELHESGYIHMHGFFFDFPDELMQYSGHKFKGKKVYNVVNFENIGFTNCTVCRSVNKASSYATKYITKEMSTYKGWQRYYISSGIKKPVIEKVDMHLLEFMTSVDWFKDCGNGFVGFSNNSTNL